MAYKMLDIPASTEFQFINLTIVEPSRAEDSKILTSFSIFYIFFYIHFNYLFLPDYLRVVRKQVAKP